MMAGVLRAVGEASLSAAVMILAALALRLRFQDRTPRRAFCLLWDMALVRLLVLGALPSPVSIRRWLPQIGARAQSAGLLQPEAVTAVTESGTVLREEWPVQTAYLVEDTLQMVTVGSAPASVSTPAAVPAAPDWGLLLTALWFGVAVLLAFGFLWSHLCSRKDYAAALPVRNGFVLDWLAAHPLRRPVQARTSDRIGAPLTYGILYPVILLPRGMDWEDHTALSCVLSHEHTHIRRFDTLRKALLAAALCLHWFNPLVWVLYVLANRDMELACDEAVLRGGADRERYALALLSMEERRGRWSASGSHFSQNALEERIKAIMKRKHISITALVAVLVVMCITTTVFASAAPEGKEDQNAPQTGYVDGHLGIVEDDNVCIMSKGGENGEKLYSVDGGKSWMSEERYQAEYGCGWGEDWQVEWWTYEDYKAWLEQEKKDLQEMIGSRGWTPSTGWFTWDQEKVDEAVALYESILEDIRNGALYSKTIIDKNGNEVEDVALGSDGPLDMVIASTFDEKDMVSAAPDPAEISGSEIMLDGKLGQYFGESLLVPANTTVSLPCTLVFSLDSSYAYISIGCSDAVTVEITDNRQHTVSVLAERYLCEKLFPGAAGAYQVNLTNDTDQDVLVDFVSFTNSEWEIHGKSLAYWEATGIAHYVQVNKAKYESNEKDMVAAAPKSVDEAALLEELKAFGIGGNANLMTYNGQLIRNFVDGAPVGDDCYSVQYVYTNPDGAVDVHTLRAVIHNPDGSYDTMGDLIGLAATGDKNFDQELIDAATFSGPQVAYAGDFTPVQDQNGAEPVAGAQTVYAEGNGGTGGKTFQEVFARYAAYGLDYQPREGGMGALSINGQPVKSFADLKPDGGTFSYQDPYVETGLKVHTVYGQDGMLVGLTAE